MKILVKMIRVRELLAGVSYIAKIEVIKMVGLENGRRILYVLRIIFDFLF